jgi:hypothetical protein
MVPGISQMHLIARQPLGDGLAERLRPIADSLGSYVAAQLRASDFTRLPVPPKSSCYFCPFHRPSVWQAMRIEEPELFERAAQLEDALTIRRAELGKDPVFLTRFNRPLRDVVPAEVQFLPLAEDDGQGGCDGGWCDT